MEIFSFDDSIFNSSWAAAEIKLFRVMTAVVVKWES